MVDPALLCKKHLLGEHGELHKFHHNFVKQHKMTKRCLLRQIEPMSMKERHDALATEMLRRGYTHASPYEQPDISYLSLSEQLTTVDIARSVEDLKNRCAVCYDNLMAG